ncbi:MAG: hypothetical protein Q9219_002602 [cf. Caloplaca sp. 3 TL-2023]
MLPEFRGPAPLHHTLLQGRETTGVTLQTLHPTSFDKGDILAQTPYPGIKHGARTTEELRDLLAPIGAQMLLQVIKDRSFVPPIKEIESPRDNHKPLALTYASKIGPEHRRIDWATWTAHDILNRQRIIGPLWNLTEAWVKDRSKGVREMKRIIWDQGFHILQEECHLFPAIGQPIIVGLHEPTPKVYIRTCDGNVLVADKVKVEGATTTEAFHAARRSGLAPVPRDVGQIGKVPNSFAAFHSQLG